MATDDVTQAEKNFVFVFNTKAAKFTLECPVLIPMEISCKEYAGRLMTAHNLPCFVQEELEEKLELFATEETEEFYDNRAEASFDKLNSGQLDTPALVDKWCHAYSQEVLEFAEPEPVCNEVVFSEVYHSLIHSPALETLLNLEHKYSIDMGDVIEKRDREVFLMEERQQRDMEEAMKRMGTGTVDDSYINLMAQTHFETAQMLGSRWASELSVLQESQAREYRDWVMTVHEDTHASDAVPAYVQRVRALSNSGDPDHGDDPTQPRYEESFTVQLGAQLKTTHNIRLVCAEVLDLCKHRSSQHGSTIVPQPQRLQTAMSLYSNSLCALVLLVDNRLNSYTGTKRDFAKVCEQSTDFHFPRLEQQLERIQGSAERAVQRRLQQRDADGDRASLKSAGSAGSIEHNEKSVRLQPGDFYITRHSNLSEVHIVFHLVCDDTVRSSVGDISSRHPVILGYRNILKACFRYDIHTITLPLLLNHEMVEEMTIPWCLKRAELIFKCVKGFMMELATWSAQQSRTIQFLVPKTLSDDTFTQISDMLPSIFRMSNPVMLAK